MAQKTITQLVDDLGGGEATQIITFSCGNAQNRIDLSDENVDKMVKGIDSCISKARKTSCGHACTTSSTRGKRTDPAVFRIWAHPNGHEVSDRGRVSLSALDAHDAR
jgi:hypothetical protein